MSFFDKINDIAIVDMFDIISGNFSIVLRLASRPVVPIRCQLAAQPFHLDRRSMVAFINL